MRHLPLAVFLVALTSLACAIGKKDGGGGDGTDQDPACAMYLECLTATAPDQVGPALESYGEDGSCWESQSTAEACAEACAEAVSAAHQALPDEPACDDGSDLNSLTVLGASTDWSFSIEDLDDTCPYSSGVLDVDGTLQGSDTAAFTFAAELVYVDLLGDEMTWEGDIDCTLDTLDFACDPTLVEEISFDGTLYQVVVELSGTFNPTYETADLVARAVVTVDGAEDCDAVSTFTGQRR